MPRRKQKKYSRPRKPFDKIRIGEENVLKEKYGLKSKREIWKADSAIARIRNLAKKLITKSDEEKKIFIERLQKIGFNVEKIADALALDKEDWLKRRLQTIVFMKKLANTPKQARQFVAHKHVLVNDRTVNIPSYQVSLGEEPSVKLNLVLKKETKKSKIEEIKEQVLEKDTQTVQTENKLQEKTIEIAN
ncbi:MAG: 30S ribosomal protein S4 [Candidatus Nanoarchaeia archaeon]|nr:30S ribosomal protein S4 [Candidatus Nanoarchaeia archaeon]MDD5741333.1 30S ribosomal protein S4 [Candidatus Nanoarchaeia archaeon]